MKLCGACTGLSNDLLIQVRDSISALLESRSQQYMAEGLPPTSGQEVAANSASDNTASPKCLCETCSTVDCEGMRCTGSYHAKFAVYACSGFTKPLQA